MLRSLHLYKENALSRWDIQRIRHGLTKLQMNPEKRVMLPKMAFTGFASRYREPKVEEGFQDIIKVNFKVCSW